MKIENRDNLVRLLEDAKENGALKSVKDISMRDVRIESADGARFKIEWYCNFCVLKSPGFSMWFDDIEVDSAHPSFDIALILYYDGARICHIGKVSKGLTNSFEV